MKYILSAIAAIVLCSTPALATYNGNPYIPDPVAVVNEADIVHVGDARYCTIHPVLYSCEGLNLVNGEAKEKFAVSPETKAVKSEPECEGEDPK